MLTYRDRSFCIAFEVGACVNAKCPRALTDEETRRAVQWWATFDRSGDAPIAMSDFSKGCTDLVAGEAEAA